MMRFVPSDDDNQVAYRMRHPDAPVAPWEQPRSRTPTWLARALRPVLTVRCDQCGGRHVRFSEREVVTVLYVAAMAISSVLVCLNLYQIWSR